MYPTTASFLVSDLCTSLLNCYDDANKATVGLYPKKYAHGFCFAVLCCGYTLTDFPISIRLTSLALWQSNDCPSASKATLMNMDKYFMWIHYERLHNHNKAKHNKTVCIFLGIYCISIWIQWTLPHSAISVTWGIRFICTTLSLIKSNNVSQVLYFNDPRLNIAFAQSGHASWITFMFHELQWLGRVIGCRIWSWSPMPCEKHGPRDSVDKNRGRRPRFLSLLRPEGHVFHTAWETLIKSYYSTLADWFFFVFYAHKY